jgi:HK97 family phage major capsid protein
MTIHSTGPRSFVRAAIMKGLHVAPDIAEEYATSRWGAFAATEITKAAAGGVTTSDTGKTPAHEFFDAVVEQSIIGKLVGLRRVPFVTRMLAMTNGSRGYWTGEGKPRPLSKLTLAGSSLARRSVSAIVAFTRESLEATGNAAENLIDRDLRRAIVAALDQAFIDADNAGTAAMPASVTAGATPINATSDPASDLIGMIERFTGDLDSAYFVTDPTTATSIATARDSGGAFLFPDIGARGGSLLQIPVIVSRSSPRTSSGGQLALVDAAGIAVGLEAIEVTRSDATALLMSDDPEGDSPAVLVSLFQTESAAMLAKIAANWETQRSGGVELLVGCSY